MNASVTAHSGVLLLIGMQLSANGQGSALIAAVPSAGRHGNPDYVLPAADPMAASRQSPYRQLFGKRAGWFRRLRRQTANWSDVYATPVGYTRSDRVPAVPIDSNLARPFRNQLYSTDRPGPDPLQTRWLFSRSSPVDESFRSPRP